MQNPNSLKEIERRAYRSTFSDGLYDISFGLIFIVIGLIPVLESAGISRYWGYLLFLLPLLVIWPGKRFITIPRLGAVEFGEKRRSRRKLFLILLSAALVLMLPLLLSFFFRNPSEGQRWGLVAIFAAPFTAILLFFIDFPRLYGYGLLLLFVIIESEFLIRYFGKAMYPLYFGIPGLCILAYGLNLLFSFMKKYPRPAPEAGHGA